MSTPSTRRRLLLLSVVAVVAGIRLDATVPSDVMTNIQPEATSPSSASSSNQPHENTTTLIASASKSRNEERIRSDLVHLIFPPKSFLWDMTPGMLPTAVSNLRTNAALNDLKHSTNPAVLKTAVKTLFDQYGVGAVTSKVFESEQYRQWSNSILGCFSKHPLEGHKQIFNRLLLHYDQKLPEMLALAKRDHATHHIAELYETIQIDHWVKNFRRNLNDLVESHEIQQWYKLKKYMKQYPAVALRARFKELKISDWKHQLADAHVFSSDAGSIVTDLNDVNPNLIAFQRLGLQYADDIESLLKSDDFKMWEGFVSKWNIGEALLPMIRGRFKSDLELLVTFYKLPEPMINYKEQVREALVDEWIALTLSAQNVKRILERKSLILPGSLSAESNAYNSYLYKLSRLRRDGNVK